LRFKPKVDRGVDYFFFRRFAGFFALAFAFLFFAIAALLSFEWMAINAAVQSRIDWHYIPITTDEKK
jgi:TRAP-type C4-dicarboxylate transport system permease small subunit